MISPQLQTAMQQALTFEQKGMAIYDAQAKKTSNPLVRKTMAYLAEQEVFHIDEINKYLQKEKIELGGDDAAQTKEFFSTTVQQFTQKLDLTSDDIAAYEAGIGLERNAYDFYRMQHDLAADPQLSKFFSFLMAQERAHYEFLSKAYTFLKDPAGFYAQDEDWMFEG